MAEVARIHNVSTDSVSKILDQYNIHKLTPQEVVIKTQSKSVGMFDINTDELLNAFPSLTSAAKFCFENGLTSSVNIRGVSAHIGQVCNNKRNQTLGYKWKFI